jgi:pimeloyl-ACP methyl ester carboxylesterase
MLMSRLSIMAAVAACVASVPAVAAAKFVPPTSCGKSTGEAFYTPPTELPPLRADTLGTILKCEHLDDTGFGAAHYRVLYLSQGPIGKPAVVSATVYLPQSCTTKQPIAAVQHGTTGLGDICAPSLSTEPIDYMAAPLIKRGMAVVATDYQGLGTPGEHPYLVGESAAYSVLDSVRALSRLPEKTCLADDVVLVGHSQGGHATLFAAQYASSYGMGDKKTLRGAIAWAPGFGSRLLAEGLHVEPTAKTAPYMTFYAMFLWGAAHYYGAPADGDWLAPPALAAVPGIFESKCGWDLLDAVPAAAPTMGELFTRKFLDASASCSPTAASCPKFEPWAGYIAKTMPGDFKASAPVLIVQGDADQIVKPWTIMCIHERMKRRGGPVELCGLEKIDHIQVVKQSWNVTMPWLDAVLAGKPAPAHPECTATLPACPEGNR